MIKHPPGYSSALFALVGVIALSSSIRIMPAMGKETKASVRSEKSSGSGQVKSTASTVKTAPESKLAQAKAILKDIESMEHPEERILNNTPGWQEERRAAQESSQKRVKDAEAKLMLLGDSIAPLLADNLNSTTRDLGPICVTVLVHIGNPAIPYVVIAAKKFGPVPNVVSVLKQLGSDSLSPILPMLESSDEAEAITGLTLLNNLCGNGNNFSGFSRRRSSHNFYNYYGSNDCLLLSRTSIDKICGLPTADKSIKYRGLLAELLGKIGPRSPAVIERLTTLYAADEPEVRDAAISSLGAVASLQSGVDASKTLDVLFKCLSTDDYSGCRADAAAALGHVRLLPERVVPALSAALKDGYPEVVTASIQSISQMGESAVPALPALEDIVQHDSNNNNVAVALNAIGNLRSAAVPALPVIIKLLQGHNVQTRLNAVNVVNNLGPLAGPAVPSLITLLSEPDLNLRITVERVLGEIGSNAGAAVPALRERKTLAVGDRRNERQTIDQALEKITGENQEARNNARTPTNEVAPEATGVAPIAPVLNIRSGGSSSI